MTEAELAAIEERAKVTTEELDMIASLATGEPHMARFRPATVLALVAEVRKLREWLARSARCPLHPDRKECHIVAFADEPVWSHHAPK